VTDVALLRRYQALLAPGTPFRDGLDRIVSGRTGALVVRPQRRRRAVSTGGFRIDVDFSPTCCANWPRWTVASSSRPT
jgi:diadenylate cyclase